MIEVTSFRNQKVAVLGLARSGLVAARALQRGGAEVMAWDDAAAKRAAADTAGVTLVDLAASDLAEVAALILSPGIAPVHPVASRARAAGTAVIGDIELLARSRRDARYVGVTGTNGKSTTTTLIGHILEKAGRAVAVGGNLGTPALALDALDADGVYVLELSSYQLELTQSTVFDVAVLLNITPDHLDRHGDMAGYVAAKTHIFDRQKRSHAAVIGIDDALCRDIAETMLASGDRQVVPISIERRPSSRVFVGDGWLIDDFDGAALRVLDLRRVSHLPGTHNWQNAAAAYAAARCLGVAATDIVAAIASFPGLAHRQELVATIDGVFYVNDSKATNADAAAKALACYEAVYWIAGGIAKDGGIASLKDLFPHIRHAFLIGRATEAFAAMLDGHVPVSRCRDLAAAVAAAREAALTAPTPGAVVLLSPAGASFDQFADFEARGDAFRHLVEALPGARA